MRVASVFFTALSSVIYRIHPHVLRLLNTFPPAGPTGAWAAQAAQAPGCVPWARAAWVTRQVEVGAEWEIHGDREQAL
jgi:hypothetical protein